MIDQILLNRLYQLARLSLECNDSVQADRIKARFAETRELHALLMSPPAGITRQGVMLSNASRDYFNTLDEGEADYV